MPTWASKARLLFITKKPHPSNFQLSSGYPTNSTQAGVQELQHPQLQNQGSNLCCTSHDTRQPDQNVRRLWQKMSTSDLSNPPWRTCQVNKDQVNKEVGNQSAGYTYQNDKLTWYIVVAYILLRTCNFPYMHVCIYPCCISIRFNYNLDQISCQGVQCRIIMVKKIIINQIINVRFNSDDGTHSGAKIACSYEIFAVGWLQWLGYFKSAAGTECPAVL